MYVCVCVCVCVCVYVYMESTLWTDSLLDNNINSSSMETSFRLNQFWTLTNT